MTEYQIEAPVRTFSGESVGVSFQKGTGYVTDEAKEGRAALEYFRRHAYGVSVASDKAAAPAAPAVSSPPQDPQGDALFDPADHSVEDVLEYLNGADYDEALRVLDAEEDAGKPRVTITKHREDVLAAKSAPAALAGDNTTGAQA